MNRLSKICVAASLILFGCNNHEQVVLQTGDLTYFPLEVGNRWVYESIRPDMPLRTAVFTIISAETKEGTEYFAMERIYEMENVSSGGDTIFYRIDQQGFVFENSKYDKIERNRFRLGAGEGYAWHMESSSPQRYIVTTSITDVTLNSGVLHECKSFSYDVPEWADEEHYIILAKGIGIVQHGNAWGFDYKLKSAKIGGVVN
jgi:hypothetical protein